MVKLPTVGDVIRSSNDRELATIFVDYLLEFYNNMFRDDRITASFHIKESLNSIVLDKESREKIIASVIDELGRTVSI